MLDLNDYRRKILNMVTERTDVDYTTNMTVDDLFNAMEDLVFIIDKQKELIDIQEQEFEDRVEAIYDYNNVIPRKDMYD